MTAEAPASAAAGGDTTRQSDLRSRRRRQLVEDVQRTAIRLFGEQGYEETSLQQICEETGISARTFFRHFDGKDHILTAGASDSARRIVANLENEPDDLPLIEAYYHAWLTEMRNQESTELQSIGWRLINEVPSVRAKYLGGMEGVDQMDIELGRRLHLAGDHPDVRLLRGFIAVAVLQGRSDAADGSSHEAETVRLNLELLSAVEEAIRNRSPRRAHSPQEQHK